MNYKEGERNFPVVHQPQRYHVPNTATYLLRPLDGYQTLINLYVKPQEAQVRKRSKRIQECSHYRIILDGYGRCLWKRRKQGGEEDAHTTHTHFVRPHTTVTLCTLFRNTAYFRKKVIVIFQKACIQQGSVLPKLSSILFWNNRGLQFMPEENFHESLTVENKFVKFMVIISLHW